MIPRVIAVIVGIVLPPIGVIIFAVGGDANGRNFSRSNSETGDSTGLIMMVIGMLLIGVAVVAARWSVIGILISGGVGVVIALVQIAVPFSLTSGSFSIARELGGLVSAVGSDASQGLIGFIFIGAALPVGAVLLGAGLGLHAKRRHPGSPVSWSIIGIAGVVIGLPIVVAGLDAFVTTIRTLQSEPLQGVLLVVGSLMLAVAAYASRGAGIALVIAGGAVAILGLIATAVLALTSGASAIVRLPQEALYVLSFGYVPLLGVLLLATGIAGMLHPRRRDQVESGILPVV